MYLVLWFFILGYIGGLVSRTIFRHAKQRCSRPDAPAFGKLLLWVRNGVLWPQKYNLLGKLCKAERCVPGMFITPKITGESLCKQKSTTQFFWGIFWLTMSYSIRLSWYIPIRVTAISGNNKHNTQIPVVKVKDIHTFINLHTKIICNNNISLRVTVIFQSVESLHKGK